MKINNTSWLSNEIKSVNNVWTINHTEDFLKSMIKRMGVDPVFKHRFMAEPEQVLRHYQVSWTAPWQRLWQMLQSTVI